MPFVPGIEVSGTIRAVGEKVTEFRPGQLVAALTIVDGGGYAEVVKVNAGLVFPLNTPLASKLDLAVAAAFPSNVTAAAMILDTVGHLKKGDSVLVHAAAGGVGSATGQMARKLGAAHVYGTVGSPDKLEYAKGLGYDEVFLRDEYIPAILEKTISKGLDIIVDPVGGPTRNESLELLRPLGRLIVMGNASGSEDVAQSLNSLWLNSKSVAGFNLQLLSSYSPMSVAQAAKMGLSAVGTKEVRVDVKDILELDEATESHRLIESRSTKGKLVLRVKGELT